MDAAELRWQQDTQGRTYLCVSGHWTLATRKPDLQAVFEAFASQNAELPVRVTVAAWDSSLLALLRRLQRLATGRQLQLRWLELPDGVERLLQMGSAHPIQPGSSAQTRGGPLTRLGLMAMAAQASLSTAATFLGEVCLALLNLLRGRARLRAGDFWLALQQCGPGALPIVALIATLVGLILAFVGAAQLEAFGAQLYIANMVAIGMTREMGALMTAVIMAGRTGAAYAAELGSMQANEEIDALKTFGFPPLEFLVLPRLLALLVAMPLLCVFADVLGIPASDVEGLATFYSQIFRQPVGRHVIRYCDSVVCHINGYQGIQAALEKKLNIKPGQTTFDGRFTLLPTCCLGNCDKGPNMMIDEDTHAHLTPEAIPELLERYK